MGQSIEEMLFASRPRVLGGFGATQAPTIEKRHQMTAGGFELACARCGGRSFRVFTTTSRWRAQDGSPQDSDIGLSTTCAACGHYLELFNAVHDGYDGELGHLNFVDGERTQTPLENEAGEVGTIEIRVWFVFNFKPEELTESARLCNTSPLDLFDFFILEGRKTDRDDWEELREYECA